MGWMPKGEIAVYIHVPFCKRRCRYCGFYSVTGVTSGLLEGYVETAVAEMQLWAKRLGPLRASSVYVGGGTPSLLAPSLVARLLEGVNACFPPQSGIEVSIEANPESASRSWLREIVRAGVNRVTFGVQTFEPRGLELLGRLHGPEEVEQAVTAAREAGIRSVGIDLIFGWPGQAADDWLLDLEKGVALDVDHISCYALSLDKGAPLEKMVASGVLVLPDEDVVADMMEMAMDLLEGAGLRQYEISNYALMGHQSMHNIHYWRQGEYIGIGPGAASFLSPCRMKNPEDLSSYMDEVASGVLPRETELRLNEEELFREWMILGLRTTEGISVEESRRRWGVDPGKFLGPLLEDLVRVGLLTVGRERIRLTRKGVLLSNLVFRELI